jgi:hypothetical protein
MSFMDYLSRLKWIFFDFGGCTAAAIHESDDPHGPRRDVTAN